MALTGAVAGLGAGILAVLLIADAAGLPGGAVLRHSLLSAAGLALVAGAFAVAMLAIVVAVRAPARRRARGLRLLDVAAAGAAVAVLLGITSGSGATARSRPPRASGCSTRCSPASSASSPRSRPAGCSRPRCGSPSG